MNSRNSKSPICIGISLTSYKLSFDFLEIIKDLSIKWGEKIIFFFHIADHCKSSTYHILNTHLFETLSSSFQLFQNLNYIDYFECLTKYDMYLNPFPFGNSNTLWDCIRAGLLGPSNTGNSFSIEGDRINYDYIGINFLSASDNKHYFEIANKLISDLSGETQFYQHHIQKLKSPNTILDEIETDHDINDKSYTKVFKDLIK